MASDWFKGLEAAWLEIAAVIDGDRNTNVQIMIDLAIGLSFIVLALGLNEDQVQAIWSSDDALKSWGLNPPPTSDSTSTRRYAPKASETRAKIIAATIRILNSQGAAAVTYRTVAAESGVALTAPAYYFRSIDGLIRVAQHQLFEASKERYRNITSLTRGAEMSLTTIADMTAAIIIKEATEFRLQSVAFYSLWLEAARSADLRPEIAASIFDLTKAWQRRLTGLSGSVPRDGIYFQALSIGVLVRAVASGAPIEMLMGIRAEFVEALTHAYW